MLVAWEKSKGTSQQYNGVIPGCGRPGQVARLMEGSRLANIYLMQPPRKTKLQTSFETPH